MGMFYNPDYYKAKNIQSGLQLTDIQVLVIAWIRKASISSPYENF